MAEMIASPFFASRSGMIESKLLVLMVAVRPILAAIALAISTSKPTALLVAVSIDSCGGEGVAGRDGSVPPLAQLGGGLMPRRGGGRGGAWRGAAGRPPPPPR